MDQLIRMMQECYFFVSLPSVSLCPTESPIDVRYHELTAGCKRFIDKLIRINRKNCFLVYLPSKTYVQHGF